MSKLFDENEEDLNPDLNSRTDDTLDEENEVPIRIGKDKIFDNDYNTGNLDFEEFSNLPKVDAVYAEGNLQECYDSFSYSRNLDLEKLVDKYFNNTEFGKLLSNKKKIPKQLLPQVFVAIREQFVNSDYTCSEIFISIAEYFGVNFEVFYENIPSVHRAELVKELDEKYGILSKKGIKKLF